MAWFSCLYTLLFIFLSSSVSSSISLYSLSPSQLPSFPLCHIDESNALLQFKNSFSIDYTFVHYCDKYYNIRHPKIIFWESGTDCCGWSGVTCNNITGHVIGLDLTCSMLRGILHSNSTLFLLRHLHTLILSHIDFRGSTIPPEFGTFSDFLHLEILFANLSGDIPLEISYLSNLQTLEVYDNDQQLRLNTSTFKRIVTNLTNLQNLTLFSVDMSRVDPTSLMNFSSSLQSLRLWDCGLRGNSPNAIFHLPKLEILYLDGNENLTGFLPKYNWSSSLRELSLSRTNFSIDMPDLTRNLKSLQGLYLRNCRFIGGSYLVLFGNLTQLTFIDLSYTNISGQIPWSSFNPKRLTFLSLAGNSFIGQLPKFDSYNSTQISFSPHFSKNKSLGPVPWCLEWLDLSDNLLNGTIPNWLYSLPSLTYLFLSINDFTGHIQEFRTTSLRSLQLNNNKLNGSIPISIFQLVNLTSLDLSSNSLSGFVPIDPSLNTLSSLLSSNLQYLRLSHNKIQGNIPKWLFNVGRDSLNEVDLSYNFLTKIEQIPWKNLQFLDLSSNLLQGHFLSNNQIRGNIPKWLWNVSTDSLYYLNLSHNFLTYIDQIPWKNLQILDVQSNLLQGHLPIPPASIEVFLASTNQLIGEVPSLICNLSSLEVLDLANNSLSGKLPPCIGNLSGNLSVLDLRMNKFHGTIPTTLFAKKNILRNLNLNGNEFEGLLPRSLLNCKKLEVLDIGNNKINGTFPHWLESLPMLQVLILRSNKFYGSIANPTVGFPFRKLRILDLSTNEFSGKLPAKHFESFMEMMETNTSSKLKYMGEDYYEDSVSVEMKGIFIELVKILTIFTTIDFSQNNFEGEIPKLIGKLKSLKGLNFSHNKLTGSIPPSFGNLSGLEWLDLSSNQLVGGIPQQLTDIASLAVLNLSENRLVGPIPRGKQFDTFENTSYSGNLGLCGLPLTETCSNIDEAQQEGDEYEQTNGFDLWKIVVMGYGCGMVAGISIGYMVLSDRRIALFLVKLGGQRWIRRIRR